MAKGNSRNEKVAKAVPQNDPYSGHKKREPAANEIDVSDLQ
jgi:hypothetical protein